jgi:beta-mannosidase
MCKGSNWVPLDAFHSRDTERYGEALALVSDIGCNILRCWGGNVYEDTEFYDYCDRHGIMIWQDFGMACHSYPRTDEFKKLLEEEVGKVVKKLRNHPSVILWSGDNEVDEMKFSLGEDPSYNVITRNWLPEFIRRHDIDRPYLPSSPYLGKGVPRSEVSESHQWGPRDYFKSDFYKKNTAHFISETGYHGCPAPESIKKFITADKVWPYENNDEWILHSTDQNGDDGRVMLMEKQIRYLFGIKPDNLDDYAEASQISQAEAKKYFIERMRVGRPYKTGVIWWNLLDGWPQLSDAIVDYYFVKKLAYTYIKRTQAPFSIISDEADSEGMLSVYACNDSLDAPKGHYEIINAESGETVAEGDFECAVNGNVLLAKVPAVQNRMYIFRWNTDRGDGFNHYYCGNIPLDIEAYRSQAKKYGVM